MVDRHRLVLDTSRLTDVRVRLDVFLEHVHAFNEDPAVLENLEYGAALSPGLAGPYDDLVAFSDLVHSCFLRAGSLSGSFTRHRATAPRAPAK